MENVISEAVKFFNLNALSSPILVKVHFDVLMTMIADTLYSMLAQKLRGFEQCDAPKIYRHFVEGKPWHQLPQSLSWLNWAWLKLKFLNDAHSHEILYECDA